MTGADLAAIQLDAGGLDQKPLVYVPHDPGAERGSLLLGVA